MALQIWEKFGRITLLLVFATWVPFGVLNASLAQFPRTPVPAENLVIGQSYKGTIVFVPPWISHAITWTGFAAVASLPPFLIFLSYRLMKIPRVTGLQRILLLVVIAGLCIGLEIVAANLLGSRK